MSRNRSIVSASDCFTMASLVEGMGCMVANSQYPN